MNWIKNSDEKLTYKNEYEEYIRDFFNYERKKEYAPSRELAQFLYEHSDSPHYYLKQYCRFAEIDNHFRRLLLKEGLRDIISLKFRFGMHKTWLALKSYK
jgi:hypothetical protein